MKQKTKHQHKKLPPGLESSVKDEHPLMPPPGRLRVATAPVLIIMALALSPPPYPLIKTDLVIGLQFFTLLILTLVICIINIAIIRGGLRSAYLLKSCAVIIIAALLVTTVMFYLEPLASNNAIYLKFTGMAFALIALKLINSKDYQDCIKLLQQRRHNQRIISAWVKDKKTRN